jgi:hypothetical protein
MDFANIHLHFHILRVGFQVLHCWNDITKPDTPPMAHNIGIFTSLEHAQDATRRVFKHVLETYRNKGYYGRCFDEVDLNLRGLITAYVDTLDATRQVIRRELLLSEFHIVTVYVCNPSWGAETHRVDSDPLATLPRMVYKSNMQAHEAVTPTTELPDTSVGDGRSVASTIISVPSTHQSPPRPAPALVRYDEERSPEWARSRIPLFARRDEGPLRRPGDPPYAQRMDFSLPKPTSSATPSATEQTVESQHCGDVQIDRL